jgi:hypothetical protein
MSRRPIVPLRVYVAQYANGHLFSGGWALHSSEFTQLTRKAAQAVEGERGMLPVEIVPAVVQGAK